VIYAKRKCTWWSVLLMVEKSIIVIVTGKILFLGCRLELRCVLIFYLLARIAKWCVASFLASFDS